ncbi:transcriptional regulator [Streptomyces rimosus]|uniref:transcriptional regulator n=1 Tax=Streptomyces rimosus TaxID=1927 RepID=UPI000B144878|nr:transcriptional regulator [Streptomyces rimosus]
MSTAPPAAPAALPSRPSMLSRLAAAHATGALQCRPGTLYLVGGRVVHAESPAVPGLKVLLTTGGRVPRAVWDDALGRAGVPDHVPGRLVKEGLLSEGQAEVWWLTALFDAAFFALAPRSGPSRFQHGFVREGGAGTRSVPAERVLRESQRRRRLLDALWPGPEIDTVPVVRRPAAGRRVPARLEAVLALADGTRTPGTIARELGRPAFHVLLEVRRLAVAGLLLPRHPHPPPGGPPVPPADGRPRAPAAPEPPDVALLRRVRDALEARL